MRTAWRSMSSTRASISACVSSRTPSGADTPEWQLAQRSAITGAICANATGVVTSGGSDSSGFSQNASAITATPATAGIHHSRQPVCQRLKNTRISAVSTAMTTNTSHASSAPKTNAKCPASIVKRTGSVR